MASSNLELIRKTVTEKYHMAGLRSHDGFDVIRNEDGLIFIDILGNRYMGLSSFAEFVSDCEELLEFAKGLKEKEAAKT